MYDVVSFILQAFLAGLSATIPPGTIFAMTVAESAEHGSKAGFLVVLGHAIVEVAVVAMLVAGMGLLLSSHTARMVVGVLGGVVLLWTGFTLVKGAYMGDVGLPSGDPDMGRARHAPITRGFIACIANPYFIVWWATVGGSFIVRGARVLGWAAPLIFLICHWASDFPWFGFISYSVGRGRRLLSHRVYGILIGLCGVSLVSMGLIYFKDGLTLAVQTIR